MTFLGHVILYRFQRDPDTGGYRLVTEETTREELPIEAVHVTGHNNRYAIDEIKVIHPFNVENNGFTAIDLNLWLESNLINDALSLKWDGLKGLDAKKISLALVIGVVAIIVVYVVMAGGLS